MEKQPILTDVEVIELLEKEALAGDIIALKTFRKLTREFRLTLIEVEDESTEMPVLERCIDFLRGKGIRVYFETETIGGFRKYAQLVAGKCGEIHERLRQQLDYLKKLHQFIRKHKQGLPQEYVAEGERIGDYVDRIEKLMAEYLLRSLFQLDKPAVKFWCEEAEKVADEVEVYLENIKDLCRAHALATNL